MNNLSPTADIPVTGRICRPHAMSHGADTLILISV